MADIDPIFEIETQALSQILDEIDYFRILKIEQHASPEEVKQAYFRESRLYHPDRYFRMAIFDEYSLNQTCADGCIDDGNSPTEDSGSLSATYEAPT